MVKLLPCPFCGATEPYISVEKVIVNPDGDSWADNGKHRFQVCCGPCATHSAVCKNETQAVDYWNRRTPILSVPEDIRSEGWTVAVHNDYRLHGKSHTFWLFTKGDMCVKGEGGTDEEALAQVRSELARREHKGQKQPSTLEMFGIVGVSEIAQKAGVTSAAVSNWRKRYDDFPAPKSDLSSGPVFDESEIDVWIAKRKL